jgi:hypothetical protein
MFRQFYATTKDRKGHEHNYKLSTGETVPSGHEITNLAVAGRFKFEEMLKPEDRAALEMMGSKKKNRRASA